MLLSLKLYGKKDPLHTGQRGSFSDDIVETNSILNDPGKSKEKKRDAFKRWLAKSQPCLFGQTAARNDKVFVCLLEEDEILRMQNGDDDLRQTITDHQLVWRRYALHGLSSSFVILLCSRTIAGIAPCDELKELCRRLMELYLNCSIGDNEILQHEEWVYLAKGKGQSQSLLKFATLPNIFCAQGDRRWWHDHRTPGAIMITSNALGHFMHTQSNSNSPDTNRALRMAMGTISGAYNENKKGPATCLISLPLGEISPIQTDQQLGRYSARTYYGKFHTDHLIPSEFFTAKSPSTYYTDLDFSYIHDVNNPEHSELMAGVSVDWYTVENSIWLGSNERGDTLRKTMQFDGKAQGSAKRWLTNRLKQRCL